jgi:hypothetical protein
MAFNAKGEWEPEDDGVETRVAKIAGADSMLMRQATGLGVAQANRRGLINSSIAGGAARAASLSSALPIASQEASQIASKNMQRMQTDTTMAQTHLELAQRERNDAAARAQGAFDGYGSTMSNIAANPKLKANVRADMQRSARDVLDAQMAMFRNLYPGAQLNWGQ